MLCFLNRYNNVKNEGTAGTDTYDTIRISTIRVLFINKKRIESLVFKLPKEYGINKFKLEEADYNIHI